MIDTVQNLSIAALAIALALSWLRQEGINRLIHQALLSLGALIGAAKKEARP